MMFQKEWEEFRDRCIPKSASFTQLDETKKAFYSGALAVMSLTSRMFSSELEVTDSDVDRYDRLVSEVATVCKSFTRNTENN